MTMIRTGQRYGRGMRARTVTGVQKVGSGRGRAAKSGRVWWADPSGKEHHCTVADFEAFIDMWDDKEA